MVTRCGRPSLKRISTGKTPAPVSWRTRTPPSCAGTTPSSASKNQVPITGCPASLSSSFVVKMRSRARASSSVGFCTKTVSERFISRAMTSIWSSESPSPSVNTASGLKRCSIAGRRSPREQVSDALELGDSPFVGDVAGIQRRFRLDQDDVDFLVSDGAVLDAARHNDKFAFLDDGFVATEFHPQRTFHDQKQFVFVFMMMPDKFAF